MRNLSLILLLVMSLSASAQKLPNKQEASVWAPANLKIDGKPAEWVGYAAYNSQNHLYYTISNDRENLYLALHTTDTYTIEKTIFGITFGLNSIEVNSDKVGNKTVVTFPTVVEVKKRDPIRTTIERIRRLKTDTSLATKKTIDSLAQVINKNLAIAFKAIGISGISDITSPEISIFNTEGIRVAIQFDPPMTFTYELAIPLKYINHNKFSYDIKLNGMPEKAPGSPFAAPVMVPDGKTFMDANSSYLMYPTNFSGQYTLAKVP